MPSRTLDAEIDRLYQLPLDEFTAARNALARAAGDGAADVRALVKPPIAAWAVNQLYWRDGDTWNALVAAAENARRAHRAVLSGKGGDVRAATRVHDEAVEQALKATLALLKSGGHPATDATKQAIATTLRAVPGDERAGRLTRALQPGGFEALAGLSIAAGESRPQKAPPSRPAAPSRAAPRATVDAKALTRARQAAASSTRALQDAESAARRAEFEVARTEREEKRAAEALEKAREALERARAQVRAAEADAAAAARARDTAADRAHGARNAVRDARGEAESAAADLKKAEKG
jgi:hypothetical protein